MSFDNINKQIQLGKEAIKQVKQQNDIFEGIMNEVVKVAPEDQKGVLQKVRIESMKAINLAKNGDTEAAQELIKNMKLWA